MCGSRFRVRIYNNQYLSSLSLFTHSSLFLFLCLPSSLISLSLPPSLPPPSLPLPLSPPALACPAPAALDLGAGLSNLLSVMLRCTTQFTNVLTVKVELNCKQTNIEPALTLDRESLVYMYYTVVLHDVHVYVPGRMLRTFS